MLKFFAIPATAAVLLAGSSAMAEASPYTQAEIAVCNMLDLYPTDYGVTLVVNAGVKGVNAGNYASTEDFAHMVYDAVTTRCPEYYGLVMRSAERHSDPGPTALY
jgi:hypothetical protein